MTTATTDWYYRITRDYYDRIELRVSQNDNKLTQLPASQSSVRPHPLSTSHGRRRRPGHTHYSAHGTPSPVTSSRLVVVIVVLLLPILLNS